MLTRPEFTRPRPRPRPELTRPRPRPEARSSQIHEAEAEAEASIHEAEAEALTHEAKNEAFFAAFCDIFLHFVATFVQATWVTQITEGILFIFSNGVTPLIGVTR